MTHVLLLDASARVSRSLSRRLTTQFFNLWRAQRPDDRIVRRDLASDPPPHVTEDWIVSAFLAPEKRSLEQRRALEASDRLIDEVLAADVIAIGTPMYNYGVPSTLKAWVDQVVRVGRTFSFDPARGDEPIEPIQTGKSLVVMTSSGEGSLGPNCPNAGRNHLDGHLATALRLIGISYRHTVRIEYQEFADERHERSIREAVASLPQVIDEVMTEQARPTHSIRSRARDRRLWPGPSARACRASRAHLPA